MFGQKPTITSDEDLIINNVEVNDACDETLENGIEVNVPIANEEAVLDNGISISINIK